MSKVKLHILDLDDGSGEPRTFDESFAALFHHTYKDFRNNTLSWYFNDWGERFHPNGIRGDVNGVVDAETLIFAAECIVEEIGRNLHITLNDDPVEARNTINKFRKNDLARLQAVITELDGFLANEDSKGAWEFLKGAPKKFTDSVPEQANNLYKYIELAVFFHTVGSCGHSIKWEY